MQIMGEGCAPRRSRLKVRMTEQATPPGKWVLSLFDGLQACERLTQLVTLPGQAIEPDAP